MKVTAIREFISDHFFIDYPISDLSRFALMVANGVKLVICAKKIGVERAQSIKLWVISLKQSNKNK